jgi:hypothetical protein
MEKNIRPLKQLKRVPNKAKLLRKLLEFVATGRYIGPWLTFPQDSCCFAFGPYREPVPIGALFLLWSAGWPYLQECPKCHGKAYMVEFGGLLVYGGGTLICPTCENEWYQELGSLPKIALEYIYKSPLIGTEFSPTGSVFGGAYASDGKRLREFLGVTEPPELGPGPSYKVAGHKFSMELESQPVRQKGGWWLFKRKQEK